MKHLIIALMAGVTLGLFGVGCSGEREPEVELLQEGFSEVTGDVKVQIDAAMAAIAEEKYEEAVDALGKLKGQELTDDQKQAIADVLVDLQTILADKGASDELQEKTQNLMMDFM